MYVQFFWGEVPQYAKVYDPAEAVGMFDEIRQWSENHVAPNMDGYDADEDRPEPIHAGN